jgi:anti-sigma28 factor (negative regulator of flagellin synthesis)
MDHWGEVELNRMADIEKLQKKLQGEGTLPAALQAYLDKKNGKKKKDDGEAVDENLRKDIAQMSAKFPEGSTVKLKNGKTGKVLGVTKDRVHVGIGDETSYHAPTAIEETTLAQQQKDKTKSQHDAHAKRMNKSARDSIKKYDQVKKDREKVSGVNEAIETGDYKIDSEKSQFNDGHRGKVVHKEKGTVMYLGGMSWKTPAAAKAHAHAYLVGYERGGETGAKNSQANYVDQNMDKRMSAKKESFKSYTEGAKEDALRAIKNDRDFKQVKDADIRATTADMKLAKKNPIQQLRKISDYGKGQMEFLNNKKLKLTKKEADALLRGFDAMKKPQDKEKYQTMISKDSAGLKHILKIVNK